MSIRNLTSFGSNLASVTDFKKEFKLYTLYAVISEAIKPLQLVGQAAQFKFESKFEPLKVICQSLRRLSQKAIEGLEGKINGQALGAALLQCLGGSDGRAQTQGVSESAAVAVALRAATGSLEDPCIDPSRESTAGAKGAGRDTRQRRGTAP